MRPVAVVAGPGGRTGPAEQYIVYWIIGIAIGKLKWAEGTLGTKLGFGSPQYERAKRIILKDAIHQIRDAFAIPYETALKRWNAQLS
jgi:hypothetical protein